MAGHLEELQVFHPRRVAWNLKTHPIEKENQLPNHHFQLLNIIFQGVLQTDVLAY